MTKLIKYGILAIGMILLSGSVAPEWGFFGHRKINRMAVFTLPPDLIRFYKENIEFITEHAVDPDKRRYASKYEGIRHYIDLDVWGTFPFKDVPRVHDDAIMKYSDYYLIDGMDTISIAFDYGQDTSSLTYNDVALQAETDSIRKLFRRHVMKEYYEGEWTLSGTVIDSMFSGFDTDYTVYIKDEFSKDGILPYHLNRMYYWLIRAFEEKNLERILRLSAEMGHYIGDAHVPLHTTKNYNGQLTDQVGIHAFWESRLPELFANAEYSFLVGKARKIDKPLSYFWDVVLESHFLLRDVLEYEQELKKVFPEDQQLCYDERLERTIRTQCPEFARAYHDKLNGMVEKRMQDAILSIGSVWYSAWIEAGQPDLSDIKKIEVEVEEVKIDPNVVARDHSR